MGLLRRGYIQVAALFLVAGGAAGACGGDSVEPDGAAGEVGDVGGEAAVPALRFELTSTSPVADDDNADARRPIELEFSEAIDGASLGAISVQVAGEDVPFDSEASGDKVTIQLAQRPDLPAQVNVSIAPSLLSTSGKSFIGASLGFSYPFWLDQGSSLPRSTAGLGVASHGAGNVLVRAEGDVLVARQNVRGEWQDLPVLPVQGGGELAVIGVQSVNEGLFVAWLETSGSQQQLYVAELAEGEWELLDPDGLPSGPELQPAFTLALGVPLVALDSSGGLQVFRYDAAEDAFVVIGAVPVPEGGLTEIALASASSGNPVVAGVNEAGDIQVWRRSGNLWLELDPGIDRARGNDSPAQPRLAVSGADVLLAYLDGDEVSLNVQVARYRGTAWAPLGAAVDVELDAEASFPALAVRADGQPVVAWIEKWIGAPRLFAAELEAGDDWRVLGMPLDAAVPASVSDVVLSLDSEGFPSVALSSDAGTRVYRFNGSPTLPAGLRSRGERGACDIPEEGKGVFPATLSATGCYESPSEQRLVSAAIPFNINSMLWSDGALKRRYLLLPEKGTIDFVATGALGMPVGTIIIKEFYLEKTVGNPGTMFPVETRFLVKRCEEGGCLEPWQGYTYQWNGAGSEGALIDEAEGATSKAWSVTDDGAPAPRAHLYPSREQCITCHNVSSGRVLGLDAPGLDRPQDYGGVVDNQLRAWAKLGLFGKSASAEPQVEVQRLPSPPDVGRSLQERTLGYFDSNCSHCHHPGGAGATIDFRYFGGPGLSAGNICNKIEPGEHANSLIYQRDENRDPEVLPGPMPPIATARADQRQLSVTAAWIDSLSAGGCP